MYKQIKSNIYHMDASAHVQYEANPVFWLATQADKMGRDWLILIQFSQTLHHEHNFKLCSLETVHLQQLNITSVTICVRFPSSTMLNHVIINIALLFFLTCGWTLSTSR